MAVSKCGSCGNHSFELKEVSPHTSRYKMFFVQCQSCGVPVGVAPYSNTAFAIEQLTEKVEALGRRLL